MRGALSMLGLVRMPAAPTDGVEGAAALLQLLLSTEAADARDLAAQARVVRDTRPAPAGWDDLENVR